MSEESEREQLIRENQALRHQGLTLQAEADQYRAFFNNAEIGMYRSRLDGGDVLAINQYLADIFGFTKEEMLRNPATMRWADPKARGRMIELLREQGEFHDYEVDIITKDKNIRTLLTSGKLYSSEGYLEGTALDITERKRAEDLLQQSEERFRILFEQAADSILLLEMKPESAPVIRDANGATCKILGYERGELLGRPVTFIEAASNAAEVVNERRRSNHPGKRTIFEVSHRCKDGTIRDFECSVTERQIGSEIFAVSVERDITEHKRMEESLHKSERKFRMLYENLMDAFVIVDMAGHILEFNQVFENMLGYSKGEIYRLTYLDITPARWHAAEAQIVAEQVMKRGYSELYEKEYSRKDGGILPVELRTFLIRNQAGEPESMWALVRDITQRKQAIQNLLQSESLYRTLVETTHTGYVIISNEGKVLDANQEYFHLSGHKTLKEILGRSVNEWTAAYEQEKNQAALQQCAEQGRISNFEIDYIDDHGNITPVEINATIVNEDGVTRIITLVRNIAERKKMELALKITEMRYRTILESAVEGILVADIETKCFDYANPAICRMLGYTPEELTRLRLNDLHPKEDLPHVISEFETLTRGEKNRSEGIPCLRKDGGLVLVDIANAVVEINGRKYIVGFFSDITERRKMEAELGYARKLEAVGQLAAGIAHEINTPIQYVGDNVNFLKEAVDGYRKLTSQYERALKVLENTGGYEAMVGEIRECKKDVDLPYLETNVPGSFDSCQDGISRISTIVQAMKEFAHPDQREKCHANLNQALQNTLTIAKNEYKYVADVETELSELPPVICHVGELNQVFLNLIVNAAHAIADVVGQGGTKGRIRIRTLQESDWVRVDIADTGTGIPETIRHRIFDPFFTTKAIGKGSGQGLTIAHSIVVNKHHGTLTFESEMGKGTTFTIKLPIDSKGAECTGKA